MELIESFFHVPRNLITEELEGIYGSQVLREMGEIIEYYKVYEEGAEFHIPTGKNYEPPQLAYRKIKILIDREARFLFSKLPDILVKSKVLGENEDKISILQDFLNAVLEENQFTGKLSKAARDCFIGKRIAMLCNFNDKGIQVDIIPSLEFIYDVDKFGELSKIICFYALNDAEDKKEQRLYRKKYWMEDGFCWFEEGEYDGGGQLVETYISPTKTEFTYIPAVIILNDGLLGDLYGKSDVESLMDYESLYSQLGNSDIDAELHTMNPIIYSIDMSPHSTNDLSVAAGAFWDLNSDQTQLTGGKGSIGILESNMSYSPVLSTTLDRINSLMYNELEIPDTSPEKLQGIVTSGKTLRAIYWSLIVRCDEKMNTWRPALIKLVKAIIEGAKLYPESAKKYTDKSLPDVDYNVVVDNQYPLPEEESEEKSIDMSEVVSLTMSRKAYMKKWRNMTDDEIDEELQQIAKEKQLFESTGFLPQGV